MIIQRLILILIVVLVAGCGTEPPSPTSAPTAEPTATEASEAPVDVSQGEALFYQFVEDTGFACKTCHYPNSDERLLGPGLLSIAERFESYDIEADDIESYITESIKDPTAFIVPDDSPFPENIMPATYSEVFTDEELDALVDYILSSK